MKGFLARFTFNAEDVKHFRPDEDFDLEANHNLSGVNVSAVILREETMKPDSAEIPDIPDLETVLNGDLEDGSDFAITGYPDEYLGAGKVVTPTVGGDMYTVAGPMELKNGDVIGCDILTSKGQSGAALVHKESGRVFGIFTGVDKHALKPDKPLGLCVRITEEVQKFLDDIN